MRNKGYDIDAAQFFKILPEMIREMIREMIQLLYKQAYMCLWYPEKHKYYVIISINFYITIFYHILY